MFRFEDPIYLWFLIAIPIIVVIRTISLIHRKKQLHKLGDINLIKNLMPQLSPKRENMKFVIMLIAVALLSVILARPQVGSHPTTGKREGIEAMIALDISNSMLASDVSPSRLERSKLIVEDLVNHLDNDKIGMIVFAGDAFVQLPITTDYVSAKMFLQDISPSLIGAQGTNISQAINLAIHSFTNSENIGKAIILITDGEDHLGNAEEAAKNAADKGINVFILGIGSTKGAPIPLNGNGELLKDKSGNTVISKLNEQMCKQIADAGKGMYLHVDNSIIAETKLDHELEKLQKGEINGIRYSQYSEMFQMVTLITLIILVLEVLINILPFPFNNRQKHFWNLFLVNHWGHGTRKNS